MRYGNSIVGRSGAKVCKDCVPIVSELPGKSGVEPPVLSIVLDKVRLLRRGRDSVTLIFGTNRRKSRMSTISMTAIVRMPGVTYIPDKWNE